jgi:tight adherence protein B
MRWVPRWFTGVLTGAGHVGDPLRWWHGSVAIAGVVLVAAAVVGGVVLVAVVLVGAAALAVVARDLNRGRADRLVDAALPALLDRVASGVRAGLGLASALGGAVPAEPGPMRADLLVVAASIDAGVPFGRVLEQWRSRRPTPGVGLTVTALALCSLLGGRTHPLDGVASTLRDRQALEREVRAASAQARASAAALVVLPWGFLAVAATQDPAVIGLLSGTAMGAACLLVGLALDLAGAWVMARMIRSVS